LEGTSSGDGVLFKFMKRYLTSSKSRRGGGKTIGYIATGRWR